jgi:outer membrane usher protein
MRGRALAAARSPSRLVAVLCLLAGTATAAADPGSDASAAELARVFKGRPRPERAPVMLVVNGDEVASDAPLVLELAGAGAPRAPSAPVLAALAPRLRAAAGAKLRAAVDQRYLSIDAMRAIGLRASYDPQRLELRIDVPPELSIAVSHDLGAGGAPDATGALAPSAVSGFINLLAGGGGARDRAAGSTLQPLHLHSDAAVNVVGWVLEARGDVASQPELDAPITVHRGDVLLTRDVAAQAVRYIAGDYSVPAAGLQASYPVLGVGVVRNFALQPYKVLRPVGSFDFVLERPSSVTVLVNGTAVQTLQLPAGRHDIRDLPLGAGVNNIELLIKDDVGIVRRVAFSAASPDALLAPGITQFSLSAGFPLLSDTGLRTYGVRRPIVSGRYRLGVTPWLTLGTAFDGDVEHQIGGGSLAIATSHGSLSADAAVSRERTPGTGSAAGLRYDYNRTLRGSASTFALLAHHYSRGFRELGPQIVDRRFHSDASIAISGGLFRQLRGQLELRYQIGRDAPDAKYIALGLFRSFGGLGIHASVSALRDDAKGDDARLFVTAHWALPGRRAAVHAVSRASIAGGVTSEVAYNQRSASPAGGLASSIRVTESSKQLGATGSAAYSGYRFTTSLAAGTTLDRDGAGSQSAAWEAATALAFAGGRVAWSRPIAGSFALVMPVPALDGVAVGVNPVSGGYAAEANSLGPAVLPNLEPYRVSQVLVEAPDLPLGSSLGPASYALLPSYRSGTLVRVGEDGTVYARGILLHVDGKPLGFAVAEVVSRDSLRPPAVLMTNRAGRFSVAGLRPGRYAIRLSGSPVSVAELDIPPGTIGVYSAGSIEVK